MIKKRYTVILSVAIISVMFGSLLYNNLVLAGKPEPQPNPVEVTNFPLDEEGNLKVSSQDKDFMAKVSETFALFSEEPLPYPSGLRSPTINVTQYKTIHLLVKTDVSINFFVYFHYVDPQTNQTYEIHYDTINNHAGERIFTYIVLAPQFHIHIHPQAEGTIESLDYATTP